MSNELFNLPQTEPPLTMKVHLARVALDEAEHEYYITEQSIGFEHAEEERLMRCAIKDARANLARLESQLLAQTKGQCQ